MSLPGAEDFARLAEPPSTGDWPYDQRYTNLCPWCEPPHRFQGPKRAMYCWEHAGSTARVWWLSKFDATAEEEPMDNTPDTGPAMEVGSLRDRIAKLEATGQSTTDKAELATDAVKQALFDTLGEVPVVVALGVLQIVAHDMIEEARKV